MTDEKLEVVLSNQLDDMIENGVDSEKAENFRILHSCKTEASKAQNAKKEAKREQLIEVGKAALNVSVFAATFLIGLSFEQEGVFRSSFMKNLASSVTRFKR